MYVYICMYIYRHIYVYVYMYTYIELWKCLYQDTRIVEMKL